MNRHRVLLSLFIVWFGSLVGAQQIHLRDDPDVSITAPSSWLGGDLCGTADGRVVGVWVQPQANLSGVGDALMVAISGDQGRSWDLLYDGTWCSVHHRDLISDVHVAVSPLSGPTAPADPRIYIVVERFRLDARLGPERRSIALFEGPLNRRWPNGPAALKAVHVHGQYASQFDPFRGAEGCRPTVVTAPWGRAAGEYLVVVGYGWPDSGTGDVYLSTPVAGHQRRDANGRPLISTLELQGAALPYLAVDDGLGLLLMAVQVGDDVECLEYRAVDLQRGRGPYAREPVGRDLQHAVLVTHEGHAQLLALAPTGRKDFHPPLVRLHKVGTLPWAFAETLVARTHSAPDIDRIGSHVYATVIGEADQAVRAVYGCRGRIWDLPGWTTAQLNDAPDLFIHAAVGAVSRNDDGGVFTWHVGWPLTTGYGAQVEPGR